MAYRGRSYNEEPKEFEEKVVQVSRVSKKTKGGNKMGFSAVVVIGDKKGRVGVGLGKAANVQAAVQKGVTYAKKHLITVPMRGNTIPHDVYVKVGAAKLILKPASPGTGVIAGGAVRAVVDAAGVKDILSKVLGTNNKASNVYATMEALRQLSPLEDVVAVAEVKSEKKVKPAPRKLKKAKDETK